MKKKYFPRYLVITFLFNVIIITSGFSQNRSLSVGASRIDITPPAHPDYPLSGNYDHEKLYIRAIVLDNGETRAVLLGADLSGLGEEIWAAATPIISKEIDCPVENIIMSATHSHSARPSGPPSAGRPQNDIQSTVDIIINAVKEAKTKLQPAQVGFGTGEAYLNVNRDAINKDTRLWTQAANLEGPSDKTLAVVMFADLEGTPIAGYMNYAMHPVNGYLSGITSADFPGAASRYVEKAFKDEMIMIFTQGASGDQNPRWLRPGTNVLASTAATEITGFEMVREDIEAPVRNHEVEYVYPSPDVIDNLERWMEALGVVLGEEAIRVMTNIDNFESNVQIWGKQEILTIPGRTRTNTGREGKPGTYENGSPVDIRLGVLGIDDIALATVNAEVYNMIAQQLKKASPMTKTVMVTVSNGKANSGYIITDSDYGKYTFQVLGNKTKPGYAEEGIKRILVELIEDYNSGDSEIEVTGLNE
jgi:hypothetical protein